ncbi:hypothetical protein Goklo_006360 [Gossypium klotzschianum]|uniref:4-alpha-glucanotransferase n=1 Tax=Gossypium klotzschianum TaxID=34286 RepID=A0A7J8VH98_9ROSI|nr:hypothetical protein [Gossypium klotzschianum]
MANQGLFSAAKSMKSVKLKFRIPYFTEWGQSLLVCGSEPTLGSWNVKKGLLLSPVHQDDQLIWTATISVPCQFSCGYRYYVVDDAKNVLRWEMGNERRLSIPHLLPEGHTLELHDLWQTGADALLFRSAFKDVIFCKNSTFNIDKPEAILHDELVQQDSILVRFKICCPNVQEGTSVYVIGSSTKLGNWKVQDGLKLHYTGEYIWEAYCVIPRGDFPIRYPFLYMFLELSVNSSKSQSQYIFLSDGMLREMPWRGCGVAVPMFSVRSEDDIGVGEFLDLKLLVDWAVESGFHLVQLLPINDTSVHRMWWDSYPYSSLSVFALHPLYLRLQALSKNLPEDVKSEIRNAKERLDGKVDSPIF